MLSDLIRALAALFARPATAAPAPAPVVYVPPVINEPMPPLVPQAAVTLVMESEGFRSTAYPDPGSGGVPWTIGYGSTRDELGRPFERGQTITTDRAQTLLQRDMGSAATSIARYVQVGLSTPCKAALISFVYNVGAGAFSESTMLRLINQGKLQAAADEFSKWTMASGRVLSGLVIRRSKERALFLSGI